MLYGEHGEVERAGQSSRVIIRMSPEPSESSSREWVYPYGTQPGRPLRMTPDYYAEMALS